LPRNQSGIRESIKKFIDDTFDPILGKLNLFDRNENKPLDSDRLNGQTLSNHKIAYNTSTI